MEPNKDQQQNKEEVNAGQHTVFSAVLPTEHKKVIHPVRTFQDDIKTAMGEPEEIPEDKILASLQGTDEENKIDIHPKTGLEKDVKKILGIGLESEAPKKPEAEPVLKPDIPHSPAFAPEKRTTNVNTLHTFEDDIKRSVDEGGVSKVKIAIAEAKKREEEEIIAKEVSPQNPRNMKLIFISFGLLVLGLGGMAGVWYYNHQISNPITFFAQKETVIPYDEEAKIALERSERDEVVSGLSQILGKQYNKDTNIVLVSFSQASSTKNFETRDFFALLETRAPDELLRSLTTDFMFALYRNSNKDFEPLMIYKMDSFDLAYSAMLAWEPKMADDIGDLFFGKKDLVEIGSDASSTPRVIVADSLSFKDEVVGNRDVRALRTKNGKLLMYYSFINNKILVIGKSFDAIDEVVRRLATRQFKQ